MDSIRKVIFEILEEPTTNLMGLTLCIVKRSLLSAESNCSQRLGEIYIDV